MRTWILFGVAVVLFSGIQQAPALAQPDIKPVFEQNPIDDWLVGLEAGYAWNLRILGQLKPFGALAYGWQSQVFRHQVGLQLGRFSLSHVDWPSNAVLGRAGESGVRLGLNWGPMRSYLFHGTLWKREGTGPAVTYVTVSGQRQVDLPYEAQLTLNTSSLWGFPTSLASEDRMPLFRSMKTAVTMQIGLLRLTLARGQLSNDAQLDEFEFVNRVTGYREPLKGQAYWSVGVERRLSLFSLPLMPRPEFLPPGAPWLEEIPLQGTVFLDLTSMTARQPTATAEDEETTSQEETNRVAWGFGLVSETSLFKLALRVIFDRDGVYQLDLGF